MKKMIDNIRKYLPAVLLLVLLLFCIRYREDLSVERILSYTWALCSEKCLFYISNCDPAACCRASVFYRNSTSGELSGKSSHIGTSILDGTLLRCIHGGKSYS